MLSEMIGKIAELSADTDSLDLLFETPRARSYDDRGKIVVIEKEVPARQHQVFSLPCLVAALGEYRPIDSSASVWVSESKIEVILNDDDADYRDNRLSMDLQLSPFFAVLAKAGWLDQKQMVDMLRHDLCGTMISPANTLNLLRNLKFTTTTEASGKIDNNSAAMGKSALAEVSGLDVLPETVMVEFVPYPALRDILDAGAEVQVDCTLFTDAAAAKLRLVPRPGELEAAKLAAMQAVQRKLAGDAAGVPVYLGTP